MEEIKRELLTPFELLQSREEDLEVQEKEQKPDAEDFTEQQEIKDETLDTPNIVQEEVEEEEETSIEDQVEVNIEGNPLKIIAEHWKEKGRLPEDFEISDDISEEEFDRVFYEYREEPLREQIRNEEIARLQDEGYSEDLIETARQIKYGVNPKDIKKVDIYNYLAQYPVQEDDSFEETSNAIFQEYHNDKRSTKTEVEAFNSYVENLEPSERMEVVQEVKEYFSKKALEQAEINKQKENQNRIAQEKKAKEDEKMVKDFIKRGVVDNFEYTPEEMEFVEKAFFDKSETIKLSNGKSVRATLYQKMLYDLQNDPEKSLKSQIDFILGPMLIENRRGDKSTRNNKRLASELTKMVTIKPKTIREKPSEESPEPVIRKRIL